MKDKNFGSDHMNVCVLLVQPIRRHCIELLTITDFSSLALEYYQTSGPIHRGLGRVLQLLPRIRKTVPGTVDPVQLTIIRINDIY